METETFLTTSDNPYNPFTKFDEWLNYDHVKGYNTCELIARFAMTAEDLTDEENEDLTDQAIDQILDISPEVIGFEGITYRVVTPNDKFEVN